MKEYTHLTREQRYTIQCMKQAGNSNAVIAKQIGCDKSTVGRELRRNRSLRGYRHQHAHAMALARRKGKSRVKFDAAMQERAESKLKQKWSPEQVVGRSRAAGTPMVSHQRLYDHVWSDKARGGSLHRFLRRASKKRRKRYGSKDRRGKIRDRVDIDERPKVVDAKGRIGDWEGDTIVGGGRKGAVVTLVERKSKYLLMRKVDRADAATVARAVVDVGKPHEDRFETITYDNGREFAAHADMAKALSASVYFAKPYHSWERGLNENTNGLIRQYIPKKAMLSGYTPEDIDAIQEAINHRPRKTLGYLTPHEGFIEGKSRVEKHGGCT